MEQQGIIDGSRIKKTCFQGIDTLFDVIVPPGSGEP